MITSKDNKRIKYARSLYNSKHRKKYQQFIVEGKNLVEMAANANCIDEVITTNANLEGTLVSPEVMKSIVTTVSDIEVIAICNHPTLNSKYQRVLVLDRLQDPGNLGTLVRSALAFNFDAVVCSLDSVDIYNEKAIRSTGGALFFIPVVYCDLVKYLTTSKNACVGTFVDGSTSLDITNNVDLVIGNEGNGISDEVAQLCDYKYRIEINKNIESLNAAIAGSILMHQIGGTNGVN